MMQGHRKSTDEVPVMLEDIVDGLEYMYRHAEKMRQDMVKRLEGVAEARDFWDSEAARILIQLERYRMAKHNDGVIK